MRIKVPEDFLARFKARVQAVVVVCRDGSICSNSYGKTTCGAARVCSPKSRIAPSVAASLDLVRCEVRAWQAIDHGADKGC
jgi:hypothetical protein